MASHHAQASSEYLVVAAIVFLVAVAAIALLGYWPGVGGDARKTQSDIAWRSANPIGIIDYAKYGPVLTLVLFNNDAKGSITVTGVRVNGYANTLAQPVRIASGSAQKVYLVLPDAEKCSESNSNFEYSISYTYETEDRAQYTQDGPAPLIGACSSNDAPVDACQKCAGEICCTPALCSPTMGCSLCGNGAADEGENCANCPIASGGDIACREGTQCIGTECLGCVPLGNWGCGDKMFCCGGGNIQCKDGFCMAKEGAAVCGDKACNGGETCATCPADCGICTTGCGNGVCDAGECASCPSDCAYDFECMVPPACGDKVCKDNENCQNCEADCGTCPPCNMNGICEFDINGMQETPQNCPYDCPPLDPRCMSSGNCSAGDYCNDNGHEAICTPCTHAHFPCTAQEECCGPPMGCWVDAQTRAIWNTPYGCCIFAGPEGNSGCGTDDSVCCANSIGQTGQNSVTCNDNHCCVANGRLANRPNECCSGNAIMNSDSGAYRCQGRLFGASCTFNAQCDSLSCSNNRICDVPSLHQ